MTCSRCGSLMLRCLPLNYLALFDTAQGWEEPTFHCVPCGNYVDKTILRNRAKQAEAVLS